MSNVAEILRLIHNLIRLGSIAEVDHDAARVRVRSGELLTDWRPWISLRAGTTRDWDPPIIGEQAVLFSPGGDPAVGVALVGLFSDAHPAPSNSANVWRREFPDGAVLEYNHAAHHLRAQLPGSVEFTAGGGITINAETTVNGTLTINGSRLTHNGKNVGHDHAHGGVTPGLGDTGEPV